MSTMMPPELVALGQTYDRIVEAVAGAQMTGQQALIALGNVSIVDARGVTWAYSQSGQLTYRTTDDSPPVVATDDAWKHFAPDSSTTSQPAAAPPVSAGGDGSVTGPSPASFSDTNPFGDDGGGFAAPTGTSEPVADTQTESHPRWNPANQPPQPAPWDQPPAPGSARNTTPGAAPSTDPPWGLKGSASVNTPDPSSPWGRVPTTSKPLDNAPVVADDAAGGIAGKEKRTLPNVSIPSGVRGALSNGFIQRHKYLLGVLAAGFILVLLSFSMSSNAGTQSEVNPTNGSASVPSSLTTPPSSQVGAVVQAYTAGDVAAATAVTSRGADPDAVAGSVAALSADVTAGGIVTPSVFADGDSGLNQTWDVVSADTGASTKSYTVTWEQTWSLTQAPTAN